MSRSAKILVTVVLGLLCIHAHSEPGGEILEYGYYQPVGELKRERNYNTATGYVRTGSEVRLVEQTTDIPLAPGRLFGFKFRIRGFPRDEVTVNLELVVSHPEIVRPNGTRVSGYRFPVTLDASGGKVESQTGYKFDKDYEMVAGEWKFQYWQADNLLLEQSFNVYDPSTAPQGDSQPVNSTQPPSHQP